MKNKIHLIMPMAGRGHRFYEKGIHTPKPLIEISGKPFFFWSTESIRKFIEVQDITFVVLKEHVDNYNIDQEIKKYYPEASIVVIPEVLNGAVLTCMKGIEKINDDQPIVFNDCDHLFCSTVFNDFCNKGNFNQIDGALLTFKSSEPKYSFIKLDENKNVIGTVEKEAVSENAICGAYYFKNKDVFLKNAEEYLDKCNYNEYYVSGVYNVMVQNNLLINYFEVDFHLAFGVPDEYEEAKKSEYFEELK